MQSNKPQSSPNRLIGIDILKLLLSYLVVHLHIESFVTGSPFSPIYYLGWFAVPLFVLIYFYFVGVDLSIARIYRLLLPFVFWSIIGFLLNPDLITVKYLLRQLITGTAVDAPLYYLLSIIWASILYKTIFGYVSKSKHLLLAILASVIILLLEVTGVVSTLLSFIPIQINFFVARTIEIIKYAGLGIVLSYIPNLISVAKQYSQSLTLSSIFLVTAIVSFQYSSRPIHLDYSGIVQYISVLTIFLSTLSFASLNKYPFFIKEISYLSKYSLGVYCIHSLLIPLVSQFSNFGSSMILSLVVFLSSLGISIFIGYIFGGKLKSFVT